MFHGRFVDNYGGRKRCSYRGLSPEALIVHIIHIFLRLRGFRNMWIFFFPKRAGQILYLPFLGAVNILPDPASSTKSTGSTNRETCRKHRVCRKFSYFILGEPVL